MKRSLARVDEPSMSPALKRAKVQAQRKFAQGSSNYTYSSSPPIPSKHRDCYGFFPYQNGQLTDGSENDEYEMNSFSSLPTIDDFLTFLCFRETDALPKKLDYLNTPQLGGHVKKKPLKLSNAVHLKNISNDRKNAPPSKINAKPNCNIAKKKLPQYTLRSRNLSCKSIATKSSHSLALKHNQRLRSKSVAEAKFIENQFQNMKNRNVITNNLSPLTSRICSNSKVKQVNRNHFKNRPLTRALRQKTLSTLSSEDEDSKRTTRRNSTLPKLKSDAENNENLAQRDKSPKRKISIGVETRKMTTKLLQVSIPKFKPTATLVDQGISRTVTRNSSKNSDSVARDALSFSISPAPTVNARPSRRTKEAAALYMEMLGKELLCPDESCDEDDNISVDSFPELPNAVEHIRREKELKEMHQKKIVEQTRRSSVPKDKGIASTSTEAESSSEKPATVVDTKKEAKKTHDGLCTRSKQYDVDASATSTRREQSVKIIRTRVKNDRFAGLNRRNSCNDVFNRSKCANEEAAEPDTTKSAAKKSNEPAATKKFVNDRLQCVNEKPKDKICKSNENAVKTTADVAKPLPPVEKSNIVEPKTAETSILSAVREKANVCETIDDSGKKNKPKKEHTVGAPVIIERISTKKNVDSKSTKLDKVKNDKLLKLVKPGVKSKTAVAVATANERSDAAAPAAGKVETSKDNSSEPHSKAGKYKANNESDETPAPNAAKASKRADVRVAGADDRATVRPANECRAKDDKTPATLDDEARRTIDSSGGNAKNAVAEAKCGSAGVERGRAADEPKQKSTKAVDAEAGTKKCEVASSSGGGGGKTASKAKTSDAPIAKPSSTVGKAATAPAADKLSSERKKTIFKKNASTSAQRKKDEPASRKSDAFSPDNEKSVYAFEPDLPTTSPPFRHLKPITPPKSVAGSSIAVQVNFKNGAKLECSNSVETRVSSTSDSGDRVFYIPIQTSDSTSSTLGVALKLDTDGANQKIIMSATLITNSTTLTTSTCTSITATTNSKKTQADVKSSNFDDGVTKSTSSGVANKVVVSTGAAAHLTVAPAPCDGAASTTKTTVAGGRKTSSPSKAAQSVKIVKLNKNKKCKAKPTENAKAKSQSPKNSKIKKKLFADGATTSADKPAAKAKGEILDAPTFSPSADEFNDPLEYIEKIRAVAEKYGLCRIVPPASFKPECKVTDEMRFTAYNQYVHKMLHRWGPNVKELMAIKKFLLTQNITLNQAPWIGGMEVDLPLLYQVVQQCGGLNAVIEKERWHQVADIMKIPKLAQDRITKLDDIYCKYLLPYDVLSHAERENLLKEIDKEWASHLQKPIDDDVFEDVDECIIKGRTMPLSCFYRIARNTMLMRYGNVDGQEARTSAKVEGEFWTHVSERKSHVCVHSGSIDSGSQGYGFSVDKKSTFKKHPWNLKVLTNNQASVLRSLGPVMGVTVPTLHVSMLYSACCWYRDPHGLPWIEYLHTGADKIWYGIPDEQNERFKEAMSSVVPRYCRDTKIWLPSDTVMIPPPLLTEHGVSLSRVVQHPGQFIVVFPKSFTSSISTGYLVSESVYFAQASWLNSAKRIFEDMQDSCEPSIFSLEHLLICIAEDTRTRVSTLDKVLPLLVDLRDTEMALRQQLKELGVDAMEKMVASKKRKSKGAFSDEENNECESCRMILFVSQVHVTNSNDLSYYCLRHAVSLLLKKPAQAKHCQLSYLYSEEELGKLIDKVAARIGAKSKKKT